MKHSDKVAAFLKGLEQTNESLPGYWECPLCYTSKGSACVEGSGIRFHCENGHTELVG